MSLKRFFPAILACLLQAITLTRCHSPAATFMSNGQSAFDAKQYDVAAIEYTKTIEAEPSLAQAYIMRGRSYANEAHFDLAIQDLNRGIELDSRSADDYLRSANCYNSMKKYEEAIAVYNKVISLEPSNAQAFTGRGRAYMALQQYDRFEQGNRDRPRVTQCLLPSRLDIQIYGGLQ